MTRLTARRKAHNAVPHVEPHWATGRTGRSLAEAWEASTDDERGETLRSHELYAAVQPAPTRATPIGERAAFDVADRELWGIERYDEE